MPQPPRSQQQGKSDSAATAEARAAEAPPTPQDDEQSFRVDEISRYLQAKGHRRQDIAGAFSGVSGSKRVTITDASKRVRSWLKAETLDDDALKDEALTD